MLISHEEVIWLHFERNTSPILRQLILSFKCQFPLRMKYESTPKQILPPFWGSEWKPLHLWRRFRHFVMNLKWNEGHQSWVQGYMRADNRFQNIRWPKRYFLRAILFLLPLSEGRGTRLTIRNKDQKNSDCKTSWLVYMKLAQMWPKSIGTWKYYGSRLT